ncbi:MAG TPA: hypothetical protein PK865_00490 [Candidatus Saccharibacteria bacterium]|nr:hypothetical protein [Candidatus Saccharibacteria bacterium]
MAVYINGQREEFKAVDYYEETAATFCSINESASENKPMTRTHMHGNVNDVVHVEDKLVTWGNFFTVLGWNVGPQYVATRDAIYQSNETSKVTYMLNGKKVDDIANRVIGDQDKLLVSYGDQSTSDIQSEYDKIKNNAKEANESDDPASCGSHHEDDTSLSARLKHLF